MIKLIKNFRTITKNSLKTIEVELDRSSVCMGDDVMSHRETRSYPTKLLLSELLTDLIDYVPNTPIWAISLHSNPYTTLGFLISDDNISVRIELVISDDTLNNIFTESKNSLTMYCKHYHQNSFIHRDNESNELIQEYAEYPSLLEKVQKHLGLI